MSTSNDTGLFSTCSMVCWILAFVAGLFVASVCMYWLGLHGLVGAVIGLIAMLALGYLISAAVCPAMTADAVVAAPIPVVPAPVAAAAVADAKVEAVAASPETDAPSMYDTAPVDADDLKVITGVGPALEKTLNEMGVYKYIQVASWTASDIAWVDARLKFKGRIERDNWVQQAKHLA